MSIVVAVVAAEATVCEAPEWLWLPSAAVGWEDAAQWVWYDVPRD
jgi:hypothetical protein